MPSPLPPITNAIGSDLSSVSSTTTTSTSSSYLTANTVASELKQRSKTKRLRRRRRQTKGQSYNSNRRRRQSRLKTAQTDDSSTAESLSGSAKSSLKSKVDLYPVDFPALLSMEKVRSSVRLSARKSVPIETVLQNDDSTDDQEQYKVMLDDIYTNSEKFITEYRKQVNEESRLASEFHASLRVTMEETYKSVMEVMAGLMDKIKQTEAADAAIKQTDPAPNDNSSTAQESSDTA